MSARKTTLELEKIITEDYLSGHNSYKLGQKYGLCEETIRNIVRRNGGKIRSVSQSRKVYSINENYFQIIDTEEKAYFLGLLFADGYIETNNKSFELGLSGEEEYSLLERFKQAINYNGKIAKRKKIKPSHKQSYRISITSDQFCKNLIDKGCVNNKSLILQFPEPNDVPFVLMNHFLRGYLDGDGSISFKTDKSLSVGIVTSTSFANGFRDYLGKYMGVSCGVYLNKNNNELSSEIKIEGLNAMKFLNILYENSSIYLKRKHENFLKYCESLKYRLTKEFVYYNRDESFVRSVCKELGIPYNEDYIYGCSKDVRQTVVESYKNGVKIESIQKTLNIGTRLLYKILRLNNVSLRT